VRAIDLHTFGVRDVGGSRPEVALAGLTSTTATDLQSFGLEYACTLRCPAK